MLLIPILGPWIGMPVLVTGAGTLFIGAVVLAISTTPPNPTLASIAAMITAIGNAIVLLGLA